MKIKDVLKETTAGAIASVATPVGGMVARQPKNSDGTAKNGLDYDNVFGSGKSKKKPKKQKR